MRNKTNILNLIKPILLGFILFFTHIAFATTYYMDASRGNDGNDGITEGTAWQTLSKINNASFSPGDVIAFKRGETFPGNFTITESGTADSRIVLTAYGTGNLPIIGALLKHTGTWINQGSNIWTKSGGAATRLWRNGIEQGKCGRKNKEEDISELGSHNVKQCHKDGTTYLYSTTNPNGNAIEYAGQSTIIKISGDYVTLKYLDVRYGKSNCIKIDNASHTKVEFCSIGYNAGYGMQVSNGDYLTVENNIFDNNFKITFDGIDSHAGTDARGSNDGFASWGGLHDSIVRYNDFINWGHASINMEALGSNTISRNRIHHNKFTAPSLHYARAFVYSGDNCNNNEFDHNYVDGMWIRSQTDGKRNHFHHNWIYNQHDTPYKNGEQGQALALEPYNDDPQNNTFEYNTFKNIQGPCIKLESYGSNYMINNTFHKNLFDNCGYDSYYFHTTGAGIYVQPYNYIQDNTYTDNAFINGIDDTPIDYHDKSITTTQFNAENGTDNDKISGNTSSVTDQGAGILDLSTIGVNAGKTLPINVEQSQGAFILTPGKLY